MSHVMHPAIAESATLVVAPDVLSSELGSEHVLLNLTDGTYYGLDEVGGEIWKRLQAPTTIAEICRALVDLFDVEPMRCRQDVETLLADLLAHGLIQIQGAAT